MSSTQYDKHEPVIIQILDFRRMVNIQLAQRLLENLSPIEQGQQSELNAFLLPDLGCAFMTATAKSLIATDMRFLYTVSHLADGFSVETIEGGKVCFSLIFKDMFLPISCEGG